MDGWTWTLLGLATWALVACLVRLVLGLLVRARDLPEAGYAGLADPSGPASTGGDVLPRRVADERPLTYAHG